jgi:hypothetical protein
MRSGGSLPDVESKIIQHPLKNIIIDTNGVTKLLKNLNTSKANGSDAIPNSILKGCAEQLSPGLRLTGTVVVGCLPFVDCRW